MSACEHTRFSVNNHIETATLSSVPPTVSSLDYLRNEFRAQQARFTNLETDIVIDIAVDELEWADHFAIPGHNFKNNAQVKFELFASDTSETDLLGIGYTTIGELIPLGLFRVGIDKYNDSDNKPRNDCFVLWFGKRIQYKRARLTIKHGYTAAENTVEATTTTTTTTTTYTSDGVRLQNSAGVVSLEAENMTAIDVDPDAWISKSDSDASGGSVRYKNGDDFYWNPNEGPRFGADFNAVQGGSFAIWMLLKSTDGNSVYTIFDGKSKTSIWQGNNLVNQGFVWKKITNVTLEAGRKHNITISARDHYISIDKIVIQPASDTAPTGFGPDESGFGSVATTVIDGVDTPVVATTDHVSIRGLLLGNSYSLDVNIGYGARIKYLTGPSLRKTYNGFNVRSAPQRLAREITVPFEMLTDNDMLNLSTHEKERSGAPFLVSIYPGHAGWFEDDYTMFCRYDGALEYLHEYENIHKTTFKLAEV